MGTIDTGVTDNVYNTEEYVYSEGLVRLVQLSPDVSEGSKNRVDQIWRQC